MKRTSYPLYFDILSIISIIAVVILSVISLKPLSVPVGSINWFMLTTMQSFLKFAIPVIVMIFGAKLLSQPSTSDFGKSCFRAALKLIAVIAFWSIIYVVTDKLFFAGGSLISILKSYVKNTLWETNHMWLIFALIGLCIVAPLLKRIVSEKSTLEYFLIIWFVFTVVTNILVSVPNAFTTFKSINRMIHMSAAIGFSGYFCLGYYLGKYDIKKTVRIVIYVLGAISICFFIFATYYISVREGKSFDILLKSNFPTTAFIPSSIFLFAKNTIGKLKKNPTVISFWAKLSLGVYMCHGVVLNCVMQSGFIPDGMRTAYRLIAVAAATYAVSFVASAILNLIPGIKKYIV